MKQNLKNIDDYVAALKSQGNKNVIDTLIERGLLNKIKFAIQYRGVKISYGYMINQIRAYARSLQASGILEGEKVLICPIDTPESIYALLAMIYIGAKPVTIKEDTSIDLIRKLIDKTQANVLFAPANLLNKLSGALEEKVIPVELPYDRSLPKGKNPYEKVEREFLSNEELEKYREKASDITGVITIDEFIAMGEHQVLESPKTSTTQKIYTLEDVFQEGAKNPTIFSHDVLSFIMRAKEFESELANTDRPVNVFSTIPLNTYEGIVKVMNVLLCGKTLCLEPIHNPKFMISSILITKPNIFYAPHDALIEGLSAHYTDERYKNARISPFTKIVSYGGILSDNEKRFIRKSCSNPLLPIRSELETSDGALLYSKRSTYHPVYESMPFVELKIKDRPIDEIGHFTRENISARSALDVVSDNTLAFKNTGWLGYKDNDDQLCIAGRVYPEKSPGGARDIVLEELQKVKGVVTVKVVTLGNDYNVAHVTVDSNLDFLHTKDIVRALYNEVSKRLADSIKEKLLFRIRELDDPMPLTSDGIVDEDALIKEDMSEAYGVFVDLDATVICQGFDYINFRKKEAEFKRLGLHPINLPKDEQ